MSIEKLSNDEKKKIYEEMKAKEAEEQKIKIEERKKYKELIDDVVKESIEKSKKLSKYMQEIKTEIFDNFESIIAMKEDLYNVKPTQRSHTFTSKDGESITLGYRVTDAYDDTVHEGITKVKEWIYTLADGDKAKTIENVLNALLKRDKNGNLKASRVLELRKLAEKENNPDFLEGVKIIEDAYNPVKSCYFIEAYETNPKTLKKESIPLSISSVSLLGADGDR